MDGEDIISNITRIEEDPFGEYPEENINDYDSTNYEDLRVLLHIEIVMIILKLLTCLCAVAANIFLTVVICKFKYLQTRANFYILNYSILYIIYLLIAPICLIILYSFVNNGSLLFCLFMQSEHTVHSLCLLVIFGLALDWFVKAIKPEIVKTYHRIYKFVFLIMYIIGSIKLLTLGSIFCFVHVHSSYYESTLPSHVGIIYLIVSVSVLVMYIVKRKSKSITNGSRKEEYSISIAGIILLTWLPLFTFHIIHQILRHYLYLSSDYDYFKVDRIIVLFGDIPIFIVLGSPIFVVYKLGRLNRNFKMAYDTCFKRSVRKYQHEDMDGDEVPDNENDDNDVNKVSYVCDTESTTVLHI